MTVRIVSVGQKYLVHSTDIKPTIGVTIGAALREYDTGREFYFSGDDWYAKRTKTKTFEWLNQSIPAGSYFSQSIPVEDFDQITGFYSGDGNAQLSFRVTNSNGSDYAWDPLGVMNAASIKASAQAPVSGMPFVKVILNNATEAAITANIYIFLGRK